MSPEPLELVRAWYDEAVAEGLFEPDAMALATASPDGMPSVRIVLLKGIDGQLPDLDKIVEAVAAYWEAGFTDVALVQVGDEGQDRFLDQAAGPLLDKLRAAAP